jgi:hypothetical protein
MTSTCLRPAKAGLRAGRPNTKQIWDGKQFYVAQTVKIDNPPAPPLWQRGVRGDLKVVWVI